jgi:hypothetical protein
MCGDLQNEGVLIYKSTIVPKLAVVAMQRRLLQIYVEPDDIKEGGLVKHVRDFKRSSSIEASWKENILRLSVPGVAV